MRLMFNWEAFEAEPGVYDWDYLRYYRDMVDWAAQHDLYVIVDIHQDAFSRFAVSGCGEGFPRWALPPFQKAAVPDKGGNCKARSTLDLAAQTISPASLKVERKRELAKPIFSGLKL